MPTIDLDQVRAGKEASVLKLTGGLAGMAKARKAVVEGLAAFTGPNTLVARIADGNPTTITFDNAFHRSRFSVRFNYHLFHTKTHELGIQPMLLN